MTRTSEKGLDLVQDSLSSALSSAVGLGRSWSIEALSAATGIPVTTLKAYRRGDASPGLPNLIFLFQELGPEFANQVLASAGLGGCRRLDGAEESPLTLNVRAAALTALIAHHMEDGRIDHREVREEVPPVRQLHEACGAFLARHGRQP